MGELLPCPPPTVAPLPPVETVTVLVARYLFYLAQVQEASPHTIRAYRDELEGLTGWLWASHPEAIADPHQLDHRSLRAYVAHRAAGGLGNSSVQRVIAAVRSFYRYLMRVERITDNPATMLRCKRHPRPLPRYLEKEQAKYLMQEPRGWTFQALRDTAILEVLYSAGLRVGELVAVDDAHVDWERGVLRVRGKGKRERLGILGDPALEALKRYREARGVRHEIRRQTDALFVSFRAQGGDWLPVMWPEW